MKVLASLTLTLLAFTVAASAQESAKPRRAPDVPFVPTTEKAVEEMLKLANVTKNDVVYDLGCGDGRIVITAARKYGARGVGIDINPERIKEARANLAKETAEVQKLVRFEENDLFEANFKDATVVTLFLLPQINLKLQPKLLADLTPGTRVVSNTFDMGEWKAEKEAKLNDASDYEYTGLSSQFFLWTIPAKR
jgi:trans-aconitate methyltransferase